MSQSTPEGSRRPGGVPTPAVQSTRRSQEEPQGHPTTPAARLNAARAAVADGDTAAAIQHIRALFAGSPHLEALFYCGAVSEQLGKLDEARSWYERVLLLDGSHTGARTRLAAVAQAAPPRSQPPQPQPPQVAAAAIAPEGFGFYAALKRDTSPISKSAVELIDHLRMASRPKITDLMPLLLLQLALVLMFFVLFNLVNNVLIIPVSAIFPTFLLLVISVIYFLLRSSARYELREGLLKITRGILYKRTVTYELFRVTSVGVYRGPVQRLVNSGTPTLTVEGSHGAAKKVRLVGLARGRELLRLQDDLRNLSQLLRQNPLIKGIIT